MALCRRGIGSATWAAALLALGSSQVHAQSSPAPWVVGRSGQAWAAAAERWIALDDSTHPGSVQPRQIPPGHSVLREIERTSGITSQRNFFGYRWAFERGPMLLEADTLDLGWHPRMWQGGGVEAIVSPIMRGLVDGDGLTSAFTHAANADGRPNTASFFTLDLGIPVPIDSIAFYPPQSGLTPDNERQRALFPRGYEVSRTNTPRDWLIFENEDVASGSAGYHPLDEILGSTFNNNTSIVSLTPELRFTRFLRFKFGEVTITTMLAEIEAFGHGYPQEARYLSRPHAFGEPVSLGRVTWSFSRYRQSLAGEVYEDPDAPVRLSLRTRAGTDPEPKTYFVFDELGRQLEVDPQTYFEAGRIQEKEVQGISGFRAARGEDTRNWNNWSIAYDTSGDEIRSSDGGGFLQFRFEITTEDPLAFGVLDSLAFEVSPLLADSALAEISVAGAAGPSRLIEVPLGVDTLFVYDLRTVAGVGPRAGFDAIELDVPAAARFLDLEIDGASAPQGTYDVAVVQGRLRLTFAEPFNRDAAFRIRFRSAIFQTSVFLEGRLVNTDPAVAALPQSIEGGDARPDVASDGIQVVASALRPSALGPLRLSSPVITPNGDGANDQAVIAFDLFDVGSGRLKVEVYDLAGRRVAAVLEGLAAAGPYGPNWGGADERGQLVAPGLYLIHLELTVDEGTLTQVEPIAVVY